MSRSLLVFGLLALLATGCATSDCADCAGCGDAKGANGGGVKIVEQPGKLRVEINGELFTEYVYQGAPRPYFYPIIGPTGAGMTRNWPMKEVEGEERDHIHHRGLWWGHRHVNGFSFWEETGKQGTIAHEKFLEVKSGADAGVIRARNKWSTKEGAPVCSNVETIRIHNRKDVWMLDYETTIFADTMDLVFGDDKDAAMAIRVAESMRVHKPRAKGAKKAEPGEGHIVMSTGVRDSEAWGKRAEWCDYHGPVEGKIAGVAILDHPSNPRHPTWWHVREYGLFAANPFGKRNFEKLPDPKAGEMTVKKGESVTFRYRFIWHEGDEKQGRIAEHWAEYAKTAAVK